MAARCHQLCRTLIDILCRCRMHTFNKAGRVIKQKCTHKIQFRCTENKLDRRKQGNRGESHLNNYILFVYLILFTIYLACIKQCMHTQNNLWYFMMMRITMLLNECITVQSKTQKLRLELSTVISIFDWCNTVSCSGNILIPLLIFIT